MFSCCIANKRAGFASCKRHKNEVNGICAINWRAEKNERPAASFGLYWPSSRLPTSVFFGEQGCRDAHGFPSISQLRLLYLANSYAVVMAKSIGRATCAQLASPAQSLGFFVRFCFKLSPHLRTEDQRFNTRRRRCRATSAWHFS